MTRNNFYQSIISQVAAGDKLLAVLVDPDKFEISKAAEFLRGLPSQTTHIFVGGSSVPPGATQDLVMELKLYTSKPIFIFPGDVAQITPAADALLFLSLISGRNSEYLIDQHVRAIPLIRESGLEVISTAYILIDGGNESAVERITVTEPMAVDDIQAISDTAKAGELLGMKLIYLEAGSGAVWPVSEEIISRVKEDLNVPLIVGGGISSIEQLEQTYAAGADMVVMGTAFEKGIIKGEDG